MGKRAERQAARGGPREPRPVGWRCPRRGGRAGAIRASCPMAGAASAIHDGSAAIVCSSGQYAQSAGIPSCGPGFGFGPGRGECGLAGCAVARLSVAAIGAAADAGTGPAMACAADAVRPASVAAADAMASSCMGAMPAIRPVVGTSSNASTAASARRFIQRWNVRWRIVGTIVRCTAGVNADPDQAGLRQVNPGQALSGSSRERVPVRNRPQPSARLQLACPRLNSRSRRAPAVGRQSARAPAPALLTGSRPGADPPAACARCATAPSGNTPATSASRRTR